MNHAQTATHDAAHQTSPDTLKRAVAASALGNATEWFDYGIYAYGLTYISAALFPGSTAEATLFALATFAISFLVRPLGGLFVAAVPLFQLMNDDRRSRHPACIPGRPPPCREAAALRRPGARTRKTAAACPSPTSVA